MDHRGWYARLGAIRQAPALQAQEADIRQMQGELQRHRDGLAEEAARLNRHRAATAAGEQVIHETRRRVEQGLGELDQAKEELDAAALGVAAVRFRMMLEDLRADTPRREPEAPASLPPLQSVLIDAETGIRVGRSGPHIVGWSPFLALRSAWTASGHPGPLRFAGSTLSRRLLVGEGTGSVLDALNGKTCWKWQGSVLDCWQDKVLLSTDTGVELRNLLNGTRLNQLALPEPPRLGWILPAGLLISDSTGLSLHSIDGRVLGRGRFGSTVVLSADRRTLAAFPMILRIPDLQPLGGLSRPAHISFSGFYLDEELLVGFSQSTVVWRIGEAGALAVLNTPSPPKAVTRSGKVLWLKGAGRDQAFSLRRWPPLPLDAFEQAQAEATMLLDHAPHRFRLDVESRQDRVRGGLYEKADLCNDMARFAASEVQRGSQAKREVATGILQDALVVEAEVLVRAAAGLASQLAAHPAEPDRNAWVVLLDRLRKPMFLAELLPDLLDKPSTRRVKGLLAACAEEALRAVGERLSARAIRGEAGEGEIEASIAVLAQIRTWVLERAAGQGWVGLDRLMQRWKRLGQEARELSDVAIATRALGRLAEASTVRMAADANIGNAALERLGRSIGDIAARSAAEAEVDALLSRDNLQERIVEGMERARRELGSR